MDRGIGEPNSKDGRWRGPAQAKGSLSRTGEVRAPSRSTLTLAVGVLCIGLGYAFERVLAPAVSSKMLPWALGRALGLAALFQLWALVMVGMWFKAPVSKRFPKIPPGMLLRLHQALTASGAVVLAIHIVSLLVDKYAGVGVVGAFVPGMSSFRPLGVGLGTVALYLGLLIGGSAALSGVFVGARWLSIHRLALVMFGSAWLHGLTSGTDAVTLRPLYAVLAATVLVVAMSSFLRGDKVTQSNVT